MEYNKEIIARLKDSIDSASNAIPYSIYGKQYLAFYFDSNIMGAIAFIMYHFIKLTKTDDIIKDVYIVADILDHSAHDDGIVYFPQIEWRWGE